MEEQAEGIVDMGAEDDIPIEVVAENNNGAEEERARLSGWIPKDEFRGDENKWVPANEWNERADNLMPIMKATLNKYEKKLKNYETDLNTVKLEAAGLRKAMKGMQKVTEKVSEQAYNQALSDIRKEQRAAAENEEWDKYDRLETEREKIEKPGNIEIENTPYPGVDRYQDDYNRFKERNDFWYGKDKVLTRYAKGLANDLVMEGYTEDEQLRKIDEEVRKEFPEKFSNPKRKTQAVDRGGEPAQTKKTNEFDKLPKEAKAQYESIKKQAESRGRKYTKADYLAAYNE